MFVTVAPIFLLCLQHVYGWRLGNELQRAVCVPCDWQAVDVFAPWPLQWTIQILPDTKNGPLHGHWPSKHNSWPPCVVHDGREVSRLLYIGRMTVLCGDLLCGTWLCDFYFMLAVMSMFTGQPSSLCAWRAERQGATEVLLTVQVGMIVLI